MEILVKRTEFTDTATIGTMYIDSARICDTLEDARRDLPAKCPNTPKGIACKCKEKVYGKTCIPAGRYRVIWRYSPKFKKEYPAIENVPHFLGILIHAGANVDHSDGCILVGTRTPRQEKLSQQFVASTKVSSMVKAAIDDGEEVWITITEER